MGQNESTEVEADIQAQLTRFSNLQISSKRQSSFEFLPDAIMIVLLKIHQIQNNVHGNNLYAQRVISLSNMKHYAGVWKIYHPEWMKEAIHLKYSECLIRYIEKLTSLLQEVRLYSQDLSLSSWIIKGAIAEIKIERPDQETIDMTRIQLSREVAVLQVIILEWLQKLTLDKQSKRTYTNLLDKAKKHRDDLIGQPDIKPEDQRKSIFSGLKTLPKKIKDKFDTIRHKKKPEPTPPVFGAPFTRGKSIKISKTAQKSMDWPNSGRIEPKIINFDKKFRKMTTNSKSYSFEWLPSVDDVLRTCYDWDYRTEYRFVGYREINSVADRWESLGKEFWANELRKLKTSNNRIKAYGRTIYEISVELARIWTNPNHPKVVQLREQNLLDGRPFGIVADMLKQDFVQLCLLLSLMPD